MEQRIEELTPEDYAQLQKQREWMLGHYEPGTERDYDSLGGKLILLETILNAGWVEPHETWKLQSLGVTFGDALIQHLGLSWVVVVDDYGRDVALRDPSTSMKVFPLTIVSKRVEAGEQVVLVELFKKVCQGVEDVRTKVRGP